MSLIQHIKDFNMLNMWMERQVHSARSDKKFVVDAIPYTPLSLIKEIFDKIEPIHNRNLDSNIAVLYTIEMAIYLKWLGFKNVTLITKEEDQLMRKHQEMIGYEYKLVSEIEGMKFDVVVGNPPYQNDRAASGRKTATKPLWFYFVDHAFNIVVKNGYIAFVTPVAWIQPTSKINKTIISHNLKWVKLFSKNPFIGVGITPSCWIAQNKQSNNTKIPLNIDNISYKVRIKEDFIPTNPENFNTKFNILSKTVNSDNKKFDMRATQEHHTGSKAHQLNSIKEKEYIYPVFHTNTQQKWSKVKGSLHGLPKVVISKTGSLNGARVSKESSISQIGMALITSTMSEADIALSILHSKLYRYILDITRSNSTIPSQLWRSIPSVDLSHPWTDEELYKYFNLTTEEIDLIEDTIK